MSQLLQRDLLPPPDHLLTVLEVRLPLVRVFRACCVWSLLHLTLVCV